MNSKILEFLSHVVKIVMVDVGYHKGHFTGEFRKQFGDNKVYSIGIDAVDHKGANCDLFLNFAVSNSKKGPQKFNVYDEPGCSSLSRMRLERLKTSRDDRDGWFCNQEIHPLGEELVLCKTLAEILNEHLPSQVIHYLKVDAQGTDLDVIKSAGADLERCVFVQMESLLGDQQMYDGQSSYFEDVAYMESRGFEMIEYRDHSSASCPEADVIYFNKRFENNQTSV